MRPLIIKDSKGRIQIIDGLRGISIFLMVLYHFGFDLVAFVGAPPGLIFNPVLAILQPLFAGIFIFVSGISCRFSRNNLKRGLLLLAFGVGITVVTFFMAMPVWFGIIHFLGLAPIIYLLLRPLLDKVSRPALIVIYIVLYLCAMVFTSRYYNVNFLWWLGFRPEGFASADYFPILPWIFIYLAGTWAGSYIVERRLPESFYTFKVPVFAAIGRNTLIIYILHQPVLYVITLIIKGLL